MIEILIILLVIETIYSFVLINDNKKLSTIISLLLEEKVKVVKLDDEQ